MKSTIIPQRSQTLGVIGFLLFLLSAISWLLYILYISQISSLFKHLFEFFPWLIMIFFTINPIASIVLGVISRNSESRNIYAEVSRIGGYILMGFLLIAIILR
ncbi:MAG TPA: hypothetical protein ENG70_05455 [Candidatus Cloacimonetes bacterium]|nr:hypothetical protein [Candidatus Cloacimonadota bacterium]HEX38283.1 hypothetical protein [Candidatus Cloacimonadota bacterium]